MEKRIVLASGGFDPLHSGHIAYFKAAKLLGDELWVGINSDEWLVRKKGKAFMPFLERAVVIEHLNMVDQVLSFEDDDIGSSNKCIEKILEITGSNTKIIVANGGDRTPENIPEQIKYKDHPRVEFAWSVGGDEKTNSSSWILEEWKAPKTYKDWGWYRILEQQPGYKVKELVLDPGQSLSMQRHMLRSENWYVLKGECEVTTDYRSKVSKVVLKPEKSSYTINKGVWHQAANNTDLPCHILEIQYGSRCSEDDIERREPTTK